MLELDGCNENCQSCTDVKCRCQDCIYLSGTLEELFCDCYGKPCNEIDICKEW